MFVGQVVEARRIVARENMGATLTNVVFMGEAPWSLQHFVFIDNDQCIDDYTPEIGDVSCCVQIAKSSVSNTELPSSLPDVYQAYLRGVSSNVR